MADPPAAIHVARPVIDDDLPCFHCGYNLRLRPIDARCPECGTDVARSLRFAWLRFADPAWLNSLRRGAAWTIAVLIIAPIGLFATLLFILEGPFATCAWIVAVLIAWCVGLWQLTAREPPIDGAPAPFSTPALLARAGHVFGAILAAVGSVAINLAFLLQSETDTSNTALGIGAVFWFLGLILLQIGAIALLVHLRKIARRDPGPGLGRFFTVLIWTYLCSVVIAVSLPTMVAAIQAARASAMTATTSQNATASYGLGPNVSLTAGTGTNRVEVITAPTTQAAAVSQPAVTVIAPRGGNITRRTINTLMSTAYLVLVCGSQIFLLTWSIAFIVALAWLRRTCTRARAHPSSRSSTR